MIESIVLTPMLGALRIEIRGDLAVMLAVGHPNDQAAEREQLSLVAGARNHLNLEFAWAAA